MLEWGGRWLFDSEGLRPYAAAWGGIDHRDRRKRGRGNVGGWNGCGELCGTDEGCGSTGTVHLHHRSRDEVAASEGQCKCAPACDDAVRGKAREDRLWVCATNSFPPHNASRSTPTPPHPQNTTT